jgi:hypothetical protein
MAIQFWSFLQQEKYTKSCKSFSDFIFAHTFLELLSNMRRNNVMLTLSQFYKDDNSVEPGLTNLTELSILLNYNNDIV